ncbi:hypothetical protein DRO22_01240 [Candidatus Bathyarchaeota archaeon]|nr:MAG: hypothetical protein DRO22_01240 [Candidatus Bathyarchaeota archaeon]
MPVHSRFKEKIDVLDLIIDVLKGHEESLSEIVEKFDEAHQKMSIFDEKMVLLDRILERLEGLKVKNVVEATGINGSLVKVKCNDWATFRAASQGALLVTFEVSEEEVIISSITDLFVFIYSSGVPEFMGLVGEVAGRWIGKILKAQQEDGTISSSFLSSKIDEDVYEAVVNPEMLRRWLSSELGLSKDKIVHGQVLC